MEGGAGSRKRLRRLSDLERSRRFGMGTKADGSDLRVADLGVLKDRMIMIQ